MTVTDDTAVITRPQIGPRQLFIDGQWREAGAGERFEIVDPSSGKPVTTVAEADADDVDSAVRAARAAFDDGRWSGLPGRERARILLRVDCARPRTGRRDRRRRESLDVGKPVSLCRTGRRGDHRRQYEYCAALAPHSTGAARTAEIPDAHAYTRREPLGVVGAITPFNFPLILSRRSKIAPALVGREHRGPQARRGHSAGRPADGGAPHRGRAFPRCGQRRHRRGRRREALLQRTGSTRSRSPDRRRSAGTPRASRGEPHTRHHGTRRQRRANIVFEDADVDTRSARSSTASCSTPDSSAWAGPDCWSPAALRVVRRASSGGRSRCARSATPSTTATVVGPMAGDGTRRRSGVPRRWRAPRAPRSSAGGERLAGGGFFCQPTVIAAWPNDLPRGPGGNLRAGADGPTVRHRGRGDGDGQQHRLRARLGAADLGRRTGPPGRRPLRAGIVWVNDWAMLDPAVPFGGVRTPVRPRIRPGGPRVVFQGQVRRHLPRPERTHLRSLPCHQHHCRRRRNRRSEVHRSRTSTSTNPAPARSSFISSPRACATPTSASPRARCRSRCPACSGTREPGSSRRSAPA